MSGSPLRIVFVTQEDPFYVPVFFRELENSYDRSRVAVVGVVIQATLGKRELTKLVRQMLDFYGPWDFLRMGFRYAANRVMNVMALGLFRGRFPGTFSLRHFFRKRGWSILPFENVNAPEFLRFVRAEGIDVVASVAASQKFKSDLLAAPRYGCINIHSAFLPRNRGMMPNFWSLYHSDREPLSAVTVHRMNEELDDGPILLQETFPLDPRESLDRLMRRTKVLSAHSLLKVLALYEKGEPPLMGNDRSRATYNSFPTRDDVRRFRQKGLKLL
jgi:methionyl-tRNA formyltransferase